jgi:molecular chaperone DnaJ
MPAQPMPLPDYYAVLGVARNANDATIKKAYKIMARRYHPDKTKGDPASNDQFQEVAEAYECLKDPTARASYDSRVGDGGFAEAEHRGARRLRWQLPARPPSR